VPIEVTTTAVTALESGFEAERKARKEKEECEAAEAKTGGRPTVFDAGAVKPRSAPSLRVAKAVCQCRDKIPAILPVLPTRAAVSLGGDAVGTLQQFLHLSFSHCAI
jgi:hypothetical protein